jgi:hypothetical protein
MFYIDKRQIANGEFGGGLSDDGDLTNMWPGIAYLGIYPEKMLESLRLHMTAYYDQERSPFAAGLRQRSLPLFTNGLATIFTDELHALEDGIQVVGQLQLLDYGAPLYLERGMETALRMLEDITRINSAGHRHFRSRYYSGTRMASEDPWQLSVARSYSVLQTAFMIAWYNGNPKLRQMIIEIADGLLEHRHDGNLFTDINFATDKDKRDSEIPYRTSSVFVAAWHLTGDKKYLEPLPGKHEEEREFNEDKIASSYREEITNLGIREYINTEGSIWIDRISPFNPQIQKDRLGGVALTRGNDIYPQHYVSWKINAPATYESAAIFVSRAQPDSIKIIAYNLDLNPVNTDMTVWDIKPGQWRVSQGIDKNEDQKIDSDATEHIIDLERGESLNLTFAPRKYNIVSLELIKPAEKGYWERPDLGIGPNDIKITGNSVKVRVHSLGSVATPATTIELRDAKGKLAATAPVPPLEAPLDLKPRWADITLVVPGGTDISSGSVRVDPEAKIKQITLRNTIIRW